METPEADFEVESMDDRVIDKVKLTLKEKRGGAERGRDVKRWAQAGQPPACALFLHLKRRKCGNISLNLYTFLW